MSETMMDEITSSNGFIIDNLVKETGVNNEDEETWLYENNKLKNEENINDTLVPTIDEEKPTIIPIRTSLTNNQLVNNSRDTDDEDDDDDDDGIRITIGSYEPELSTYPTVRQKTRTILPKGPVIPPKPAIIRGVDLDAQGTINGVPTFEYDISIAYKDEEKPWKKSGADISDYFNYGFTDETWIQHCDRQRRLRLENNLTLMNNNHISPIIPGHPPMMHPMNPYPLMMIHKPINVSVLPRPGPIRKLEGKIDVIGTTDQTSRRPMLDTANNLEYGNEISFQQRDGQTVGDLVSNSSTNDGTTSNGAHHVQTLNPHHLSLIRLPPPMQFQPPFIHPHVPGARQFFPRGHVLGIHGERPPPGFFVPHHPRQPWDTFPVGQFPSATTLTPNTNERIHSSRSPTPEIRPSNSGTPEENRLNSNNDENDKSSKDDRHRERSKDNRDYYSSSHHRSSSYRSHHRNSEHEYERPKSDRKSSRDRDDKYERYSRKRHHKDNHRRSSKTNNSIESSEKLNEQSKPTENVSSSDKSHHKKSSKRSKHDNDRERSRRRSKDKTTNQTQLDTKESTNE